MRHVISILSLNRSFSRWSCNETHLINNSEPDLEAQHLCRLLSGCFIVHSCGLHQNISLKLFYSYTILGSSHSRRARSRISWVKIQYPVWMRINPFIDCILFGGNLTRVRDGEKLFLNKFLFALLKSLGVVSLKILRDEGRGIESFRKLFS